MTATMHTGLSASERARAVRQRLLLALVQVLSLATWFSASAVVPTLEYEWKISAAAAVWLTASTQLGFVMGAVVSATLNIADRVAPQALIAIGAGGAALCTLLFVVFADGLVVAIPLRLMTGISMAAIYPVGIKLMASWAPRLHRSLALGILIGALTLGSSLPHLIGALPWDWRQLMATAAALPILGGIVSLAWLRPGPYLARGAAAIDPGYAIRMFRHREQRLVNVGYLGHMWELYALWTWLPAFASAGVASGTATASAVSFGVFLAVGVAGLAGCLIGGWAADQWGRRQVAIAALVVSGACCLASPLFFRAPIVVLFFIGLIWGAAVIADSGVFSTMLSELVDGPRAGTALTAQTAAGFLLTIVTIQVVPLIASVTGWRYALIVLALGPVAGVIALLRLRIKPTEP